MARVTYRVPQPIQPVDGVPVYTKVEIYRSPSDGALVPAPTGVWTKLATPTGDTTAKWFTLYEDDTATVGNWYRHRYTNTAVDAWSDYSIFVQTDENLIVLWSMADIASDDVDEDDIRDWVDRAITDLWTEGVWVRYPASPAERVAATITVTSALVGGTTDERYALPADLEEVCRVETVGSTSRRHGRWLFRDVEWEQEDRWLRLMDPVSTYNYMLHGKRRYRDVSELPETTFVLVEWMVRAMYLQMRHDERANAPRFQVFDRASNITPEQIDRMLVTAKAEVSRRIAALQPAEYAIDLAPASAAF